MRILICILALFSFNHLNAQVLINEFKASNDRMLEDFEGDYPDWIELYNAGETAVDLSEYLIKDQNPEDASGIGWQLPPVILNPDSYFLLFASGKNLYLDQLNEYHTDFNIGSSGNHLAILKLNGEIVDHVKPVKLKTNVSYGRKPDGSENWFFFKNPTPAKANLTESYSEILQAPAFSHNSAYYSSAFYLRMKKEREDVEIYFTLDGSVPTKQSRKYKAKQLIYPLSSVFPVQSMEQTAAEDWYLPDPNLKPFRVVRAAAFKDGAISSEIVNRTFICGSHFSNLHELQLISIITDPAGLFDYEKGIYVPGKIYEENDDSEIDFVHREANYSQRGLDWEREAHISIFDKNLNKVFEQGAGLRIHGNASRAFPQKSLRLYARGRYGESWFNYPLFDDKDLPAVRRFLLRNSGQDRNKTLFRDAFIQNLVKDLNFERQAYRPAVVYLNGEYWGIHNIRERIDPHYFTANFGIAAEDIEIVSNRTISQGETNIKKLLSEYVSSNNMAEEIHFDILSHIIDMDNYIDYHIAQIFIANTDWPGNNVNIWRDKASGSLWRWLMFDTDFGYGKKEASNHNTLLFATTKTGDKWPNPPWSTLVFRNMLKNSKFSALFIERFTTHLNTTFKPDRAIQLIREMQQNIDAEVERHIRRWPNAGTKENWQREVKAMERFAFERPYYVRQHLSSYFGLKGTYELSIKIDNPDKNLGYIRINDMEVDLSSGTWTGHFFKGIKLKIEAVAYKGARFIAWEGDVIESNSALLLDNSENIRLIAKFEKDKNYTPQLSYPEPYSLAEKGSYHFSHWSPNRPAANYPKSMRFYQINKLNATEFDEPDADWIEAYNYEDVASFRGLRGGGLLFNGGMLPPDISGVAYPFAVLLALDTRDVESVMLEWKAGSKITANNPYGLIPEYRIGSHSAFKPLPGHQVLTYFSNTSNSKAYKFELPSFLINRNNVQIRWKYFQKNLDGTGKPASIFLDEINVYAETGAELEELHELNKFSIYPNPTSGLFILKVEGDYEVESVDVLIYDMAGRIVDNVLVEFNIEKSSYYINAAHLRSGVYMLKILTAEGLVYNKRLVISR